MPQRRSHLGRKSALGATLSSTQRPVVPAVEGSRAAQRLVHPTEENSRATQRPVVSAEEDSRAAQLTTKTPSKVLSLREALDLIHSLHFPGSERAAGEAKAFLMP